MKTKIALYVILWLYVIGCYAVALIACQKTGIENSKIYKIEAGKQYASGINLEAYESNSIIFEFYVHSSWERNSTGLDMIYGIKSKLDPQEDSYRLSYKCVNGEIALHFYVWTAGINPQNNPSQKPFICTVDYDKWYVCEIVDNEGSVSCRITNGELLGMARCSGTFEKMKWISNPYSEHPTDHDRIFIILKH